MATIEVTEYRLPAGERIQQTLEVSDEHIKKAEGMCFSVELLRTGQVVAYARYDTDPEEHEEMTIFQNKPGNLREAFEWLIDVVHERGRMQ